MTLELTLVSLLVPIRADVEAAAELGRTLLERNRELETTIRQQQAMLDDQDQEMQVRPFPQYLPIVSSYR